MAVRNRREVEGQGSWQEYMQGNVAVDLKPRRQLSIAARKNREKARYMSLGYVLFLAAALSIAALVLINYVTLQAEVINRTRGVEALEREYNNLRLRNDETLSSIERSIDYEEIRRIAIGELGMVYAGEGQIRTYVNEGIDFFRSVTENRK